MRARLLTLLLLMAPAAFAQNGAPDCLDPAKVRNCTFRQLLVQVLHPKVTLDQVTALRLAVKHDIQVSVPAAPTVTRAVQERVANENVATTPPQSSDARVHASRQNFNIPLSAAINTIDRDTDKQSIVVRFNTLNAGPFAAGITGTITQPSVYAAIGKKVTPEMHAEAVTKRLSNSLEETDNLSLSVHLAPETPECTANRLQRSACYGLDPRAYDTPLNEIFAALLGVDAGPSAATNEVATKLSDVVRGDANTDVGRVATDKLDEFFELALLLKMSDAADSARENTLRASSQIPKLAKLIEQQPQWTLTLNANRRDRLVGPNSQSADLEYRRGRQNLNTVSAKCGTNPKCLIPTLKDLKSDTFVFGVGIKQTDSYRLDELPAGILKDDDEVTEGFSGLHADRIRAYLAKMQYGRDLASARINDKPLRLDIQVTWEQVTGATKESRPYDTRFVAGATLSVPLGEAITIPVTLSYANHEDFLEDQQKELGVHFGLTYRLPFKAPK